jgi:tRNA (adenine22-N1)-methyltransferase
MKKKTRLLEIIKLIDRGKTVIDIGTDHGLVPLFLVNEGICDKVIATDISEKSLQKLEDRLDENLRKKISTKVTDGFEGLEKKENQIAIIAGMGAVTIIDIISKNMDFARNLDYMILEGNIGNEKLREFLNKNSFTIVDERLVYDNKKYYDILKVKNGKEASYDLSEIYFGKFNIDRRDELLKEKIDLEYKKNLKFKDHIEENSYKKEGLDLIDERIKAIEEVYEKWK